MIERYATPQMRRIFGDEHRYETWHRVETAVCAAYVELDLMDRRVLTDVQSSVPPSVAAVQAEERKRDHEVLGFLAAWADQLPTAAAAQVHRGLTSYDLVDTANAVLFAEAGVLLRRAGVALLAAFRERIERHWDEPCLGRTHGMAAQATTVGRRLASLALELRRATEVLDRALDGVAVGTISGAVGTYGALPLELETRVLAALGVGRETLASQVIGRDRHAQLCCALAVVSAVVEHLAVDIRLLSQTGIDEVEEPRPDLYQGSSIMPHKHNPTGSERLSGLARLVRGYAVAALETVALWNERDLSNSAVERVALVDALSVTEYQLTFATKLLQGLEIRADVMIAGLRRSAVALASPAAMTALIDRGVDREDAYRSVQSAAESSDPQVRRRAGLPGDDELDQTTLARQLPYGDVLYDRVMKELA